MQPHHSIQDELDSDETLLWEGRPRQGLIWQDKFPLFCSFGLILGPFLLAWLWALIQLIHNLESLWHENVITLFLIGILTSVVIAFFFLSPYIADIGRRSTLQYAITNKRALIFRTTNNLEIRSYALRRNSKLILKKRKGTSGTIRFGETSDWEWLMGPWRHYGPKPIIWSQRSDFDFDDIHDARTVYNLIRETQKKSAP